jgi:hypothetical protein
MVAIKILIGLVACIVSIALGLFILAVIAWGIETIGHKLHKRKVFRIISKVLDIIWYTFWSLIGVLMIAVLSYDFGSKIINLLK